ncbi:MAG: hypothetical protein ACJASL_004791 [Paraglaciecola sp.]|jgi:hypothetical protein
MEYVKLMPFFKGQFYLTAFGYDNLYRYLTAAGYLLFSYIRPNKTHYK